MTRALGFLTGVCLTVAAFVLVLDRWQFGQTDDASLATLAIDVEPLDAAPGATDKGSVTIGDAPDTLGVETVTEDMVSSVTPSAETEKIAAVEPDAESVLPHRGKVCIGRIGQDKTAVMVGPGPPPGGETVVAAGVVV